MTQFTGSAMCKIIKQGVEMKVRTQEELIRELNMDRKILSNALTKVCKQGDCVKSIGLAATALHSVNRFDMDDKIKYNLHVF